MRTRFSAIQVFLHWLTLLMIILTYLAILTDDLIPYDLKPLAKELHFNFGLSVWVLMFIRLGVRHMYAEPPIKPSLPAWQNWGAKLMHIALYLIFLSLPILGFMAQLYGGKVWFILGWQVPQWVTPNPEMRHFIKEIHEWLANAAYFVIGGHTLAALYHHYIRKDNTLIRMLPAACSKDQSV